MWDALESTELIYAPEACAACLGTGEMDGALCRACSGIGHVLVCQPSLPCPRCEGTGRATPGYEHDYPLCIVCRGSGWAMVLTPY